MIDNSVDCVECMAASDNVVRAGLTPKFKDVDTLVGMLTYTQKSVIDQILCGQRFKDSHYTLVFDPPIEEFTVLKTELKSGEMEVFKGFKGPSVLIVTGGSGFINADKVFNTELGSAYFLSADQIMTIESGTDGMVVYIAYCEL